MAAIAASASLSLGPSHCSPCHTDDFPSISCRAIGGSARHTFDGCRPPDLSGISFRCRNPFFGSALHGSSAGHDLCHTKVSVAADYSDSVPDSSNYVSGEGYHPLEEVKVCKRVRETKLAPAEIARTTVEANSSALLVFPGAIHREPHEQISWAEFKYVIDDFGDIFFEIFDDENILQDPGASNPVNALIGMDIPSYENKRIPAEYDMSHFGDLDDVPFGVDYYEVVYSEESDVPVDWGLPDMSNRVHPIYFSKCLTKAVNMDYYRKMDHPSNGVSVLGCLRPAFADEETYLRRLFSEDRDGYDLEWQDDASSIFSTKYDGSNVNSTLYRFEIMRIELSSVYGVQLSISLQDFQDAEPDALAHATSAIVERFGERGMSSNIALKALCRKKGLHVEGASLIGVDSLGMDVRVFTGAEVKTHRFPFKSRATSEVAAEKQIHHLLFPRSRRKKLKAHSEGLRDSYRS